MGGRGGASGMSNAWKNEIPKLNEYQHKRQLPELQGSEKQVKWAKEIRDNLGEDLWRYVISRTSDGKPSGIYNILSKQGIKGAIQDIEKSVNLFSGYERQSNNRKKEIINRRLLSYKELARRIKKYNEIMSNRSAAFWIDNRRNSQRNYMNERLKKIIDEA